MKRLVICCDGTWNTADQHGNGEPSPTNVVRLGYRVAKQDAGVPQILYYGQGVGTGNLIDRVSGGAFGHGLEDNVYEAYRFLVGNYEPGDELFLFGFSRGAFTARSLAGMIRKCGILARQHVRGYPAAIALYRDDQHPDSAAARAFRRAHAVGGDATLPIRFIGVWDTVGALGIPLRGLRGLTRHKYQFHDTELSGSVAQACHALAIDERRAPFEPTLWAYRPKPGQTVEQVWFAGVHSDIGGGYADTGLADITLEWMIDRAQGAGLAFDATVTSALPLAPDPRGTLHNSKLGLYRLTPGLVRTIGWTTQPNGTRIPDPTQTVHASVRERWDALDYRPPNLPMGV